MRPNSKDFLNIFLNDIPLMDVRAAIEVDKGAFPQSINRPLLDDAQRHEIGICYKEAGEEEAILLGLKLATPEIRAQRLADWKAFCTDNPNGYLYCFRGGLRSHTTQAWLKESGVDYPLIDGGYKAMRRFLMDQLDDNIESLRLINICGPTGSGKTRVLQHIHHQVDFEGLAQHRGSAFGRNADDFQPSSIDWENAVSIVMLKHRHRHAKQPLFVEDEGRLIGRIVMPENLCRAMTSNELAILEEPIEKRIAMTVEDYVTQPWQDYQQRFGPDAEQHFSDFVLGSLTRIKKRLGGDRFNALHTSLTQALDVLFRTGEHLAFDAPVKTLLADYYDPMYHYQFGKRQGKVIFQGNSEAMIEWANAQ
ncbi:tRNA 2-selenouridine(34) synthase MnmH [Vibrio sp. S11_S32]|uniref:tRNA 2-selenouridine(34) synthase MnmH n=1 Tax=Vibrio sp. S11_S32 TaxID=2720225 RepID=UPI00168085F7|nr:tRNA 2-selenouridine(34) synthase MnmH [Vibrio sp. S11_S32]MBD1577414.1 tRNA 2-selenouridine(34) synthase MnmH [Vibrio sp. S11_S32]